MSLAVMYVDAAFEVVRVEQVVRPERTRILNYCSFGECIVAHSGMEEGHTGYSFAGEEVATEVQYYLALLEHYSQALAAVLEVALHQNYLKPQPLVCLQRSAFPYQGEVVGGEGQQQLVVVLREHSAVAGI